MPDIVGIAVRFAGHVGIYVGRGEVVEWRGFRYGCVITELTGRPWTHWYKLPWTEYVDGELPEASDGSDAMQPSARTLLRRGDRGEDVRELQAALIELGFLGSGGDDGDFGMMTDSAVRSFQTWAGIEADGEVGPITDAAIDKALQNPFKQRRVKNGSWRLRSGPGTEFDSEGVVRGGVMLFEANTDGWVPVYYDGNVLWISEKALE